MKTRIISRSMKGNSIFCPSAGHGNVVLNFMDEPEAEFPLYAHRFHRAGKALAVQMMDAGGYNDLDACPIVFLYRHSLELYIKAIVRLGMAYSTLTGVVVEVGKKALNGHVLTKLLPAFRKTFDAAGWTWHADEAGLRTIEEFEHLVREFEEIDAGSFAFRYPVDTENGASVPRHFMLNVPDFCRRMDALLNLLDAAATGLAVEFDAISEQIGACD